MKSTPFFSPLSFGCSFLNPFSLFLHMFLDPIKDIYTLQVLRCSSSSCFSQEEKLFCAGLFPGSNTDSFSACFQDVWACSKWLSTASWDIICLTPPLACSYSKASFTKTVALQQHVSYTAKQLWLCYHIITKVSLIKALGEHLYETITRTVSLTSIKLVRVTEILTVPIPLESTSLHLE